EVVVVLKLTIAFVIAEKEKLVLNDRAADGEAELIALQRGLVERQREDKSIGVEVGIAQELPGGTVELIAAGLHGGCDHRAAHASVLGRERARDDFEFGYRVGRGLHELRRIA